MYYLISKEPGNGANQWQQTAQTPMGALSVVICAILSHFFLNESLTTFGALGCALCIVRTHQHVL
jgi:hypothetical protein